MTGGAEDLSPRANFFAGAAADRASVVHAFAVSLGALPARTGASNPEDIDHLWRAVARAGIASPGLAFADWVELDAVGGVVPALLVNCPDVAAFLAQLGHYHPLIGRSRLEVAVGSGGAVVEVSDEDGNAAHPDLVDACFALLFRMLERLTGPGSLRARVELRRWAPHDFGGYEERFGIVRFGAERDRCLIGREALALPLVRADPALFGLLRPYADVQLSSPTRNWSQAVSEALVGELEKRPAIADVARSLAVSTRTLQQHLKQEGTTYGEILDTVRRQQVMGMLAVKGVPLVEIAGRVGFASLASLSRAVRRWTGQTSTQLRIGI